MDIHPVAWDDERGVGRIADVLEAVRRHEQPWSHPYDAGPLALSIRYGWDGEPAEHFLVRDGGVDVATATYETTTWDNRHVAWLGIDVHPAHRRQGYGSAALEWLMDRARREGRTSVGSDSWDLPGPPAFAARHGFERKQVSVNRRQFLAKVDPTELELLCAEARAAARDYELIRRVGRTPPGELAALSELTASINDAPIDDLDIEDEAYPPERIVSYESAQISRGHELHRVLARHRDTGELAGHTVVAVEGLRPWIGHQHDTTVARAHRGHRLGLLLKADMVRWLLEAQPQLQSVDTWNAESNDHMVGVNETLGYEVMSRAFAYQRSL